MFLERIEIQGFKSFAEKTHIDLSPLEKQRGITAIVGPNGSGKSNISDAVRWVLGEQSIKNLRGKKSEDVIFSGSEKRNRLSLAEVTLVLNNENPPEKQEREKDLTDDILQGSHIEITRRLYRSGESLYLLNQRKVRLFDITLLLARAHFGVQSYAVISQGMADALLSSSPKDRKDFFDEAAGIKEFQIKRDISLNKLHLSLENLDKARALVHEISPHLQILSRQMRRLKQREELERELEKKLLDYFSTLWKYSETELLKIETEHRAAKEKLNAQEEKLKKIEKEIQTIEHVEQSDEDPFHALQKTYQDLLSKKSTLKEKEYTLKNTLEVEKRLAQERPMIKSLAEIIDDLLEYTKNLKTFEEQLKKIVTVSEIFPFCEEIARFRKTIEEYLENLRHPKPHSPPPLNPEILLKLEGILKETRGYDEKITEIQKRISLYHEETQKSRGKIFDLQRNFQSCQMEYNIAAGKVNEWQIEKTRVLTRRENTETELKENNITISQLENHVSEEKNVEKLSHDIQSLRHRLFLIGGIDPETIKEFTETKERFDFLEKQIQDLQKASDDLTKLIEELDQTIQKTFHQSFTIIQGHFEKYFQILFDGGKASLSLIKEEVEREEEEIESSSHEEFIPKTLLKKKNVSGIEIMATPPGKKVKSINMLSGGEKALTSIALLCAIISAEPSPFVFLDEVDASLDEANSLRFANILDELSHKTQFIVITHNRNTMEKASILYGVAMGRDGVSKLLSVHLEDIPKS